MYVYIHIYIYIYICLQHEGAHPIAPGQHASTRRTLASADPCGLHGNPAIHKEVL